LSASTTRAAAYRPRLDNLRGILWMLAAITALTGMFGVIKLLTHELPVFVIALMRTTVSLTLLLPWLLRYGLSGARTNRPALHFWRAFCGIASFVCVIYALKYLLLADTTILSFTSPFWSILISALVLGETLRFNRLIATVVGFVGVVIVVQPQGGVHPAALLALLSALLTSLAMIAMKRLSATEPPDRIVFYFMLFASVLMLPPAVLTWQTPTVEQFGWLVAAGVLGFLGQSWLARAYDAAEVNVVAPFDFGRVPLAALIGFAAFGEVPTVWSGLGTLVIIGASVFIARGEARGRAASRSDPLTKTQ
jgi:drug/metabolite transporter (DMT)-like permease